MECLTHKNILTRRANHGHLIHLIAQFPRPPIAERDHGHLRGIGGAGHDERNAEVSNTP